MEELRREMQKKDLEFETLSQTSERTLWERDLDALLEVIDAQV